MSEPSTVRSVDDEITSGIQANENPVSDGAQPQNAITDQGENVKDPGISSTPATPAIQQTPKKRRQRQTPASTAPTRRSHRLKEKEAEKEESCGCDETVSSSQSVHDESVEHDPKDQLVKTEEADPNSNQSNVVRAGAPTVTSSPAVVDVSHSVSSTASGALELQGVESTEAPAKRQLSRTGRTPTPKAPPPVTKTAKRRRTVSPTSATNNKSGSQSKAASTARTPRRLLGMPPFTASGPSIVSSSFVTLNPKTELEKRVDAVKIEPLESPSTTSAGSSVRRSKRQSDIRDRGGSDGKKTKYPEGEWVSTGISGGRGKTTSTNDAAPVSQTPQKRQGRRPKKPSVTEVDEKSANLLSGVGAAPEEHIGQSVESIIDAVIEKTTTDIKPKSDLVAAAPDVVEESDIDEDEEDVPLAQIALDKKVAQMLDYVKKDSPVTPPSGDGLLEINYLDSSSYAVKLPAEKRPSDASLFCADSDGSDGNSNEEGILDFSPNGDLHSKRGQEPETHFDVSTQYPCTVCRRLSLVSELIRCQNCPRYFHHECVKKGREEGYDPARRRFCPKCARSGPGPSSNMLASSIAKTKKVAKLTLPAVKYRRNADSLFDVGDLSKTCPGCRKVSSEVKKKRELGEDYSIYCNVDCVMKTARKTRRAMKGQEEERVLVMDTVAGNVLEKRQSPFLRNFSAWLRKHQRCYPILPEPSEGVGRRSTSPDEGTSKTKDQADSSSAKTVSTTSRALAEQESRKLSFGFIADSSKVSRSGSSSDQAAPVDPGRLNVRKALRDVLLLRAKDADDVLLTNEEIKQLAVDLEQEIQKAHKEENAYKSQCRNLIANLRNPSNKGLFRRLLNGDLSTRRAALLTASEMCSTEYSYWAAAAEQERAEEQERLKSAYMETSKLFSRTKVVTEADSTCDIFGLLHSDTTSEHKSHLFDLNCKVCTGKQKEDDTPAPLVRRDRKDSSLPRTSVTLTYRPELGEKLIKREDGKLDIVYSVPTGRKSDPLQLESSSSTSLVIESTQSESPSSPVMAAARVSATTGSTDSSGKRSTSVVGDEPAPVASGTASVDSPVPTRLSEDKTAIPGVSSASSRPLPPTSSVPSFWHGLLDMPQWFRFQTSFKPVSGPVHLLKRDLPSKLDVVGRIPSKVVYDYLTQIRKTGGKDIITFRLPEPPLDDDRRQWDGLFANMVQRQRFCVIENKALPMIKDFYILPLRVDEEPNEALLPFHEGPGLEVPRKDTILGLVVRHRERQGGESIVKKLPSLDERSPLDTDSPSGKTPSGDKSIPNKPQETSVKMEETPPQDMDYMKIIKFHSSTVVGGNTGEEKTATDVQQEEKVPEASTSTSSAAASDDVTPSAAAMLAQPKLKQLLDEIGQAQNPTELANKILNCLNQSTALTASASALTSSVTDTTSKIESATPTTSAKAIVDPRLRASSVATSVSSSPKPVETGDGSQSRWQPMVTRLQPPAAIQAAPAVPPPGYNIPPPMTTRPPPFPVPPYGAHLQSVRPPPLPPDLVSRPHPGPGVMLPFSPGFAPPPAASYSVPPPPFLLAPPPPPPPPPQAAAVGNRLEEGEVSSSESEVEDEDDERWPSRKPKMKKGNKQGDKGEASVGGRPPWSRWDRVQPTEKPKSWAQTSTGASTSYSSSSSAYQRTSRQDFPQEDSGGGGNDMYAQLNPIPESKPKTPTTAPASSGGSGAMSKQAFYGPRRSSYGGGGGFSSNDQYRKIWK